MPDTSGQSNDLTTQPALADIRAPMAATDGSHRPDEAANPIPWWLLSVGALLLVAMVAVVLVQWRQYVTLAGTTGDDVESALEQVYRLELLYTRLAEHWPRPGRGLPTAERETLNDGYEQFAAALAGWERSPVYARMREVPEFERAAAAARRFVHQAAALIRGVGAPPPADEWLAQRDPMLAVGEALRRQSSRAAAAMDERTVQRQVAVRRHNLIGIALTLFLSVLTLAFAAVALRQVRRLQSRRAALESLSASLQVARREADAANAAKSEFLAHMSHELRTPFQGLLGMLSLLRESGLDARQQDHLRIATESADHLLRILNDLLDLSQLESGRLALRPAPTQLRALLREVESLMRPQALRKGLALHVDIAPAVPEVAQLDATRVKQVLFNLLANAVRYTDRGQVVLEVRRADVGAQSRLVLAVADTGPGIDESTLAALLAHGAPMDHSRARRQGGTGLGLAISLDLARLMGGRLAGSSRLGRGSRFELDLPLIALPGVAAPSDDLRGPAKMPALHVLVAEDHEINRQYIAAVLDRLGHQAFYAANGAEAVEAVQRQRFDVVLMDLHMPTMDGIEATRAIRALPDGSAATLPILALTADAFAETRERCLLAGMNDFLTKPITAQDLAARLRRLFGGGALAEAAGARGAGRDANAPAPSPAVLDPAAINQALQAMSRERFVDLVRIFLDDAPGTLERLRAAVRDAQPLDLRVNAHAARGAALNLGMAALATTAQALQEGAAHLPAHEIALLVHRFELQLHETREALRGLELLPASATPQ